MPGRNTRVSNKKGSRNNQPFTGGKRNAKAINYHLGWAELARK